MLEFVQLTETTVHG